MHPTFVPARLRKYFIKNFNLIRKYVHGSSPHEKFWMISLTTFDFLVKSKPNNFHIRTLFYRITVKLFYVRNAFVFYFELISKHLKINIYA